MNLKFNIVFTIISLLIVCKVFSATVIITPTGTDDDTNRIQTALNALQAGDKLMLNGDFKHKGTIYLPSNFTWILNGSLTLGDNAVLDRVGWVKPGIDARRPTGISETFGGATNIDMSGGTYYGNVASNSSSLRFINFVSVTNSRFYDMLITEVSNDNFTLGPGCNNNECRNLIASFSAMGNALTDKGDHNTWIDCIASDCGSDGWTPKCQYSTFIRCIAANNAGSVVNVDIYGSVTSTQNIGMDRNAAGSTVKVTIYEGGLLEARYTDDANFGPGALLDIRGGTFKFTQDELASVNLWISQGRIVGFGGTQTIRNESVEGTTIVTVGTPVSVADITAGKFNVYPNPASNKVSIEIGDEFEDLKMINMLGKTVYAISNISNAQTLTIDVSDFTKGVYFISVVNEGQKTVKKIV